MVLEGGGQFLMSEVTMYQPRPRGPAPCLLFSVHYSGALLWCCSVFCALQGVPFQAVCPDTGPFTSRGGLCVGIHAATLDPAVCSGIWSRHPPESSASTPQVASTVPLSLKWPMRSYRRAYVQDADRLLQSASKSRGNNLKGSKDFQQNVIVKILL